MPPPLGIEVVQRLAEQHGGVCLSRRYVDIKTPLRFRCARGHEWSSKPDNLRCGHWCPACAGVRRGTLRELRQLARAHQGAVLSQAYMGSRVYHAWRCARGHTFEASPHQVRVLGRWCSFCRGTRWNVEKLGELARERGGACLAKSYADKDTPVRWRCGRGHVFEASVAAIRHRREWCPRCRTTRPMTLARAREAARARGGSCSSSACEKGTSVLSWRCAKGHAWRAAAARVAADGHWCPICARRPGPASSLLLEELREVAGRRGGRLLSSAWAGELGYLEWECALGHAFRARPGAVRKGGWCRVCKRLERLGISEMQQLARARGGDCLSLRYANLHTVLRWRCALGHEWRTKARHVRAGTWCPTCARARSRFGPALDLATVRADAEKRGGRCLSSEYVSSSAKLEWECALGHRWHASASSVRRGHWCHVCAGYGALGIDAARAAASARGGECLSPRCASGAAVLRWRCRSGHDFRARLASVRRGRWCSLCNEGHVADETLAAVRAAASAMGIELVSTAAVDASSALRFTCARGHVFRARVTELRQSERCPLCAKRVAPNRRRGRS
ncbi:MAG: hypothetical protein U0234_15215 [Sandaracinus sp.]